MSTAVKITYGGNTYNATFDGLLAKDKAVEAATEFMGEKGQLFAKCTWCSEGEGNTSDSQTWSYTMTFETDVVMTTEMFKELVEAQSSQSSDNESAGGEVTDS